MNKQGHSWDSFFNAEMQKKPTTCKAAAPVAEEPKPVEAFNPFWGPRCFATKTLKNSILKRGHLCWNNGESAQYDGTIFFDNVGVCNILVLVQLFEFQILDLNGGNPAV